MNKKFLVLFALIVGAFSMTDEDAFSTL